jgi:endonuclease/exonuclease/phosphatase family metal-dependent hydrolase
MDTAATGRDLRIATLNAWGTRGDWAHRRDVLADGFAALRPDLVTLQETIVTADYDQARDLLGPDYRLVHQRDREPDGQGITTASRWPVGQVIEVDLNVTPRTADFACTSLITEVLAPGPLGRVWLVNNLPSWEPHFEHERQLQAVKTAEVIEDLLAGAPGHVVIAGDFDADPDAASVRFWTGRQALDGFSVCYRDAWAAAHPGEPGGTYGPSNPLSADWDWPFRRIDYILVRMQTHYGPSLAVTGCQRIFDQPGAIASDHYGLVADLARPPAS